MLVLVTRPHHDAVRTAEKIAALGHRAMIDPVIEIEPLSFEPSIEGIDAIAFTSANAVRAVAGLNHLKNTPVFTVGSRTTEAAREAGFEKVTDADGDVNALGELIATALSRGSRVLHLAGEVRAGDLPGRLAQSGISTEVRAVYRAKPSTALKADTIEALRHLQIDAVLHYSERSAETFFRLAEAAEIRNEAARILHLCLSSAVAEPLKFPNARIEVSKRPDEQSLLELLTR